MLRCAICHRRLTVPAFRAPAGWAIGPICAQKKDLPPEIMRVLMESRRAGLLTQWVSAVPAPKRKRKAGAVPATRRKRADAGQMALDLQCEPAPATTLSPPA